MAAKHALLLFFVLTSSGGSRSSVISQGSSNYQYDTNYTDLYYSSNHTDYDYSNYTYHEYSDALNNDQETTSDGTVDNKSVPDNSFDTFTDGRRQDRDYNEIYVKAESCIENIAESTKLIDVLLDEIKQSKLNNPSQSQGIEHKIDVEDMYDAAVEYLNNAQTKAQNVQKEIVDSLSELSNANPNNKLVKSFSSLQSTIANQRKTLSQLSEDLRSIRDESFDDDQKSKLVTDEEKLYLDSLNRKINNNDINNDERTSEFSNGVMDTKEDEVKNKVIENENNNTEELRGDTDKNHKYESIFNEKNEKTGREKYENTNEASEPASINDSTDEGSLFEVNIDETSYNQLFEEKTTDLQQDENLAVLSSGHLHSRKTATDADNNIVKKPIQATNNLELSNNLIYLLEQVKKIVNQENERSDIETPKTTDDKHQTISEALYDKGQILTNSNMHQNVPTPPTDTNIEDDGYQMGTTPYLDDKIFVYNLSLFNRFDKGGIDENSNMHQNVPTPPTDTNIEDDGYQMGTTPYLDDKIFVYNLSLFNRFDKGGIDERKAANNLLNRDDDDDDNISFGKKDPTDEDSFLDLNQEHTSSFENDKTEKKDSTNNYPFEFVKSDKTTAINPKIPINNTSWDTENVAETDQLSNNLNLLELINGMSYQRVNMFDPQTISSESEAYETMKMNLIDSLENYVNGEKDNDENIADENLEVVSTFGITNHAWEEYLENETSENADWNKQMTSDGMPNEEMEFVNSKSFDENGDLLSYNSMLIDEDVEKLLDTDAVEVFKHDNVSSLLVACICLLVVLIIVFFGLIVIRKRITRRSYACAQVPYAVTEKKRPSLCNEKRFGNQDDKTKVYDIEV